MSQLPRRRVLTALAFAPMAGTPLAAVLSDPRLARAAAAGLEEVSLTTAGGKAVKAALALPAKTPAPAILLVHEWWGLNDQIKAVAAEFAREGYVALAVDLYDGRVATARDQAGAYMQAVDPAEATDTLASWVAWLRRHPKATGKVGTVGWCFGGGWSLNASIAAPVEATVIYYGRVDRPAEDLKSLEGPVLGHFATRDKWIDEEMVAGFERAMRAAGKSLEVHWYEADHAFANPTGARYDAEDAQLAWRRTLAFFRKHLNTKSR
ncbi:MAG: dienelactone hydrolase family protein [Kiloniellaceae bacterium]